MDAARHIVSEIDFTRLDHLDNDTFFASPGYASLWGSTGGQPVVWLGSEAGRPVAALLGVEFGRGPLCRFQAMPDGTYARLRLAPGIDRKAAARALLKAVADHGYLKVHLTDFGSCLPDGCGFRTLDRATEIVAISAEDWQPPDKKLVAQIAQAERQGITVEPFQAERHLGTFLDLMQRTEQRHDRRPRYPEPFFRALADLAQRDRRVRWLWCEHEGRPAASHLLLAESDQLLSWQTYFDKALSFLKPNQYILFTAARAAAAEGMRYLNLGASPEGAEGLTAYKRRWGGQTHRYRVLVRTSWLGRLL